MAGHGIAIRIAEAKAPGVQPDGVIFNHHLTDRAQVSAESLTGGHLLHLAVAGCLFNDILRKAANRGIALTKLDARANGGFAGDPPTSTGITCSVDLAAEAPGAEPRQLVADREQVATIPQIIRHGTHAKWARFVCVVDRAAPEPGTQARGMLRARLPGRADLGACGGLPEQCSQLAAPLSGKLRAEVTADRLPVAGQARRSAFRPAASSGDRPEDVVDTTALSRGHVSSSHDGEALRR
jgi:hypothetical protein